MTYQIGLISSARTYKYGAITTDGYLVTHNHLRNGQRLHTESERRRCYFLCIGGTILYVIEPFVFLPRNYSHCEYHLLVASYYGTRREFVSEMEHPP
ncbi:hypothetical protein CEXT_774101 [Caerostris extrusa]|uniref:Uncharacterized protein n=1 Tax=Caerostris extrusa TaxID=172846 RepID=A0AAV4NGI7_CAEEX|nr:hypothetical protein CEXT_774101 [Caerostris extrusa]